MIQNRSSTRWAVILSFLYPVLFGISGLLQRYGKHFPFVKRVSDITWCLSQLIMCLSCVNQSLEQPPSLNLLNYQSAFHSADSLQGNKEPPLFICEEVDPSAKLSGIFYTLSDQGGQKSFGNICGYLMRFYLFYPDAVN